MCSLGIFLPALLALQASALVRFRFFPFFDICLVFRTTTTFSFFLSFIVFLRGWGTANHWLVAIPLVFFRPGHTLPHQRVRRQPHLYQGQLAHCFFGIFMCYCFSSGIYSFFQCFALFCSSKCDTFGFYVNDKREMLSVFVIFVLGCGCRVLCRHLQTSLVFGAHL